MTDITPHGLAARGVRVTLEEAQSEINGLLVAEILRDFGINFKGVYPDNLLARAVGPEQSMIGLAIKRGHLMEATPEALADLPAVRAMVEAERERCMRIAASLFPGGYDNNFAKITAAIRQGDTP